MRTFASECGRDRGNFRKYLNKMDNFTFRPRRALPFRARRPENPREARMNDGKKAEAKGAMTLDRALARALVSATGELSGAARRRAQ
jgi:hypothetical protein